MRIQVSTTTEALKSELVCWLTPETKKRPRLPDPWNGVLGTLLKRTAWKGAWREKLAFHTPKGDRLGLLVGLGPAESADADKWRRAAALCAREAASRKVGSFSIVPPGDEAPKPDVASALAEGLRLAAYRTPAQRREKSDDPFRGMTARIARARKNAAFDSGVERGLVLAQYQNAAREWGDLPSNLLTPTLFAERAARLARQAGMRTRVYRKADLERMGMGGILAVNRGSREPPVLIEAVHRPKRFRRTVALVGKGVTFDTGGISLKPPKGMEEMKYDMCGGAAVLGAAIAAARLELPIQVAAIVPATDNMPGGQAQKPGDVIRTASGTTVEVLNTDAEGRLILADGLHHAGRFDPDYVVDLATLTGACVVALGHDAAGLYANDEGLRDALVEAGRLEGETVWPMPLFEAYDKDLESKVADWKNVGPREAGAGTAAWFLSKFAEGRKWAHLDIAGVAYGGRQRDDVGKGGASGFGVRLLARWLESLA